MTSEQINMNEVIAAELKNPDLEGQYVDATGQAMLDRRYTVEAIGRMGLSPRTADLNLIGPERVAIPKELLSEGETLDEPATSSRARVKSELLARGLPGVNI
ncbi:MAG TPA: hypothetical protein VK983_04915 [Candidatus Limnocylindrales bacterium]|nr:hypothetical protein [Candidatus Limnocylindrales bacterium]